MVNILQINMISPLSFGGLEKRLSHSIIPTVALYIGFKDIFYVFKIIPFKQSVEIVPT
jgi:hypothetical protein